MGGQEEEIKSVLHGSEQLTFTYVHTPTHPHTEMDGTATHTVELGRKGQKWTKGGQE